jgi:hypothetical protein
MSASSSSDVYTTCRCGNVSVSSVRSQVEDESTDKDDKRKEDDGRSTRGDPQQDLELGIRIVSRGQGSNLACCYTLDPTYPPINLSLDQRRAHRIP